MAKLGQVLGVPTAERVLLGAEDAEKLLGINVSNRNIKDTKVRKYAHDMLTGNWLETGETLSISKTDVLIDGQHRLLALVRAAHQGVNVPGGVDLEPNPDIQIPFFIVRGLDDVAQSAIDIGAPRTLADTLHLPPRNEKNPNNLAATLRVVHAWESGYRVQIAKQDLASNATLLKLFDDNQELFRNLVAVTSNLARKIDMSPKSLSLVYYLLTEIDSEEAEFFFARLADGQGLVKGDPIYELQQALDRIKRENGRRPVAYPIALVIKAWNAYRNGETIGLLTFKMGGKSPEKFPEPL